ncbi:MAG: PAS domain S-box protein [Chthoniobacteraceae bacterium]
MNWKRISQTLSVAAFGIGLCGLGGWVFGIDALKRIHPSWVTMKANTALCLMFAGAAVAVLRDEECRGLKRRFAQVCGGVIVVVGALTFCENLAGWDFGIDQALFRESVAEAGRSFPGRMGPASAMIFMLLGSAILLLDFRTRRGAWPAQWCATAAAALTVLIFLGYFYNVDVPPWIAPHISIALHTVVAFLMLCAALLLARSGRGYAAIFLAENTSGVIARRMLPTALLAPALLGWLFVLGREAGYYGRDAGVALLAVALTVLFTGLVWWTARALERTDAKRRAAVDALVRSEHELSDFFENTAIALHWVGPDGCVQRVNDAELALLGYTREEYVGRSIAEFHASEPVIADILARLTAGETLSDYPAQLRCKDGSLRDVLIGSSVYREDGKFIHTRCFTRDVTELKRAETARAQLAAIVTSSHDAIVSKNLDGIVLTWNAGAERIFGYAAEEMIGQSITRIIPADRLAEETDIQRRLRAGDPVDHFETVRATKDGRLIDVSVTISPMRDASGTVIGASKSARDITQRKQFEAELREARDTAEAANRAKDEFLAALSHELRTPLTPVLMLAADMEQSPELPEAVRHDFAMIRKNVELEARIIDDLLDLTRITRGKLALSFGPVDVHALIEHALAILRSDRETKDIAIDFSPGAACHHANGDGVRLQQVFWNVLKNAIKFTPHGGRITIRSWNEDGRLRVSTADTGLGITPEEMPRIFTAFAQGSEAAAPRFGGLGLGLSITALLVREHHGRIWAESAGRDQGATFHIDLPLATAAAIQQAAKPSASPVAARSLRILLVEDHEDTRSILLRLMTRWGHTVATAASVSEARGAVTGGGFDLLLSDVGLPDGTGYDVIAAWREKSDAPAVAMTGFGMQADIAHTQAAGFADHIVKPVAAERLREVLKRFPSP